MNTSAITANAMDCLCCRRRRLDKVTAIAADVINTNTPVAYAPPCAVTFASKSQVMKNATDVNTTTSARVAVAQLGAIPNRGRQRGTRLSSPAIADAVANQGMNVVDKLYEVPTVEP